MTSKLNDVSREKSAKSEEYEGVKVQMVAMEELTVSLTQ